MHSLMSNERKCYVCGTNIGLHKHHIYEGTGRRKLSERYGCWCYLCGKHHNLSNEGVHYDNDLDTYLKTQCERKWLIENDATIEDFIKIFKRNYI